jgi:hypothetical protein
MKAGQLLAGRQGRTALLISMVLGWTGVVLGAATERGALLAIGAGVVAITNLIIAKAMLEGRTSLETLNRSLTREEKSLLRLHIGVDRLVTRIGRVEGEVVSLEHQIDLLRADTPVINDRLTALGAESASLAVDIADVRAQVTRLDQAHEITRTGLVTTKALADKLAERASGSRVHEDRLRSVAVSQVTSPLLSVAIPSFNRPTALAGLLAGLAEEVDTCPDGLVEVCITDDASPDPETLEAALAFAERYPFASLHVQPSNIGLERNVMAAAEPCRGDYLMVVGNDDLLAKGALAKIVADIGLTDAPVLLYGKRRINLDGSPHAEVAGSIPIELGPDESHVFDTLVEAASEQGLLSTFGFAGPIVVRREPYVAVDPEPYLGLTLYARACVLIEAFADAPVFYRNTATILHRTQTPAQKHAESLGRREEEFMSGGRTRLSRYFGTTLAAALQRLVDRGAIDHKTVAGMPERLMSDISLVDWIAKNRRMEPTFDSTLDPVVVDDADRLFAGLNSELAREVR